MARTATRRATVRYDAAERVEDYLRALDSGRAAYQEADTIVDELLRAVGVGETIRLDDGREYVLVDQFATTNKVWKPTGVSRYTLEKKRS